MLRIRWIALIGLAMFVFPLTKATTQPAPDVSVRIVKYDGLAEEVAKHRGKVVLVDFWSTLCIPCIKSFPRQVALYQAHKNDGLVVISVSTDQFTDPEGKPIPADKVKQKVLTFLEKKGATFPNLILDESPKFMEDKFGFTSIPTIFVFDREGRWTRFTEKNLKHDEANRYPEIEALVKQYLKK